MPATIVAGSALTAQRQDKKIFVKMFAKQPISSTPRRKNAVNAEAAIQAQSNSPEEIRELHYYMLLKR